ARSTTGPLNALAVLTLTAAVGFLINNLTAPPDQSLFLRYVFPWLAGMTVHRSVRVRIPTTDHGGCTLTSALRGSCGRQCAAPMNRHFPYRRRGASSPSHPTGNTAPAPAHAPARHQPASD